MARPRKEGKRATGIQGKHGKLYAVISSSVIENGKPVSKPEWVNTNLADVPENIEKATAYREKLLYIRGLSPVDRNILLTDYLDRFLEEKRRNIADTTFSSYFYRVQNMKTFFGDTKVREINKKKVAAFYDALFEEQHLQHKTVKSVKVLFHEILEKAVKEGILSENPSDGVALNKSLIVEYAKDNNKDEAFFSYDEVQIFLNKIKDHPLYELFYLALYFGLRREEVLGLRWSSIDLIKKEMGIRHTVTKGTKVTRADATKTITSKRTYPLTDEQVEMFRNLKKREDDNRNLFGREYNDNEYVFKHPDGKLFYPDYPTKAFAKIIRNNPELPQDVTFHGLRTSCISILVHEGMDIKSIQKWVGHKEIDTTLKYYAKVKEKEAKIEISEKMNGIVPMKDYTED
ncbi:MAG: site-specific integrase [Lachnospiraceae bacterium]|nr:site-specific integrase [Lachnospiraceae bacterium]